MREEKPGFFHVLTLVDTVHVVVFNTSTRATVLTLNALKCFFSSISYLLPSSLSLSVERSEKSSALKFITCYFSQTSLIHLRRVRAANVLYIKNSGERIRSGRVSERRHVFSSVQFWLLHYVTETSAKRMLQDTFNFDISIRQDLIPMRERITSDACSVFVCKWFFN